MWYAWLGRMFPRRFDWLQVEVTSHCNARCAYCPHTVFRSTWTSRHLSLTTFRNLAPDLKKVNLVFLQGWGEPFLHPDFFHFVSLAKEAGCRVGATTNGTLLTGENINRVVESGIDLLAFSLAGVGEAHDFWRAGAGFQQVREAIAALQDRRRRLGKSTPHVHIAYLLLRSGLGELERLPAALRGLDIGQVVISTLDLVPSPELEEESLAGLSPRESADIIARLQKVAETGLPVYFPRHPAGVQKAACPENVLRAAVISATGDVSPCVFTNIPATGAVHYLHGRPYPLQPLCFGNVQDVSFREIWRQPTYASFRRSFEAGVLAEPCRHCLKLIGSED
ncbi:radical SAM protein [Desulfobacca acetoxidans]|uniref:Radical SAM domain protein n=1 Tax=Desulfobacca acetoxidans (strain ATCC 700848 / DSM 11109 / ASRB2) TaxID=880072 RepID=F2NFY8_DESAR|nr:radical SAM protein [Desulfobacca acetoxidans]AEB08401.1 Radical SAM domain protein [Desulfobacca acetoxidans DSM 11109]